MGCPNRPYPKLTIELPFAPNCEDHSGIIETQLDRVERKLDTVIKELQMATLNDSALLAAVTNMTTVSTSVITLVQGMAANEANLSSQLADAIASEDPAALAQVQTDMDTSATTLNAQAATFAAAVVAYTPAAPPVGTVPPVVAPPVPPVVPPVPPVVPPTPTFPGTTPVSAVVPPATELNASRRAK